MNYQTSFWDTCPQTGRESFVEVLLFRDEAPADWVEYWGHQLRLPATMEVDIISVWRDGVLWLDYPERIASEVSTHDWEPLFIELIPYQERQRA